MTIDEFSKTESFSRELQSATERREKVRKQRRICMIVEIVLLVAYLGCAVAALILDGEEGEWESVLDTVLTFGACLISICSGIMTIAVQGVDFNCGLCVKKEFAESSLCLAQALSCEDWADFCENGSINVKISYTKDENAPKKGYPYRNTVLVKGKTRGFLFDLACFNGLLGTGAFAGALCIGLIDYIHSREAHGEYFSEVKLAIVVDEKNTRQFYLIKKGKQTSAWKSVVKQTEKARQLAEQKKYS